MFYLCVYRRSTCIYSWLSSYSNQHSLSRVNQSIV